MRVGPKIGLKLSASTNMRRELKDRRAVEEEREVKTYKEYERVSCQVKGD
jgi:hypothetical protein